jgi:outer membrane translocation and assembly module TamA
VVNPTTGRYFSANGQLAARQIGSEVGFVKSYLTGQLFRTLPHFRRTVFATSARLGMAYGFPRKVVQIGDQEVTIVVRDLPASERFFAGGDTTVRGFALDQLGTPSTIDSNGFALGGNAVVILNAELRVPVYRGLGAVGFFDAGNVFGRTSEIDLGQLRSSVGFGFRYRSPVGPIRVDVGFKTRTRELTPGVREAASALHISLGQAF